MYCIIDIETTGLSKNYHHITEIAAVKFDGNQIVGEWETLINPQAPIPKMITNLTGIDDQMVKYSPTIQEVLPDFIEFMGDDAFVAHNTTFDHGFIQENLDKWYQYRMPNQKLCTKLLANRITHHLPSKSLGALCQHFGVTNTRAHRAMADVLATVEILKEFIQAADRVSFTEQIDLFTIQSKPVPWCRQMFR